MERATIRDIIALIIIAASFILIALGRDAGIMAILTAVAGYYFGRRERTQEIVEERLAKKCSR